MRTPRAVPLCILTNKWKRFFKEARDNPGAMIEDCLSLSIICTSSGSQHDESVPLYKFGINSFSPESI
jgi:hypothetical protein